MLRGDSGAAGAARGVLGPGGCREATGRVRSLDGLHLSWLGGSQATSLPARAVSKRKWGLWKGASFLSLCPDFLGWTLPVYRF